MRGSHERLRVGPAGWSYADWKGIVYPSEAGRRFDPLEYLSGYFDVVEINSSFYRPPPPQWTRSWVRRVEENSRFQFTAKLWRRFTHDREAAPAADDVRQVREGLDVLAEEDRLLAVLVQFPWSFRNGPEARRWLARVVKMFGDYPLVVEVRHASWDDRDVLDWLVEKEVGLAAIDQPLHDGSLGRVVRRTGPIAYFRFHGRNFESWFAEGRPSHERYDYLYDRDELDPWVDEIRAAQADPAVAAVIAITNNHYRGQGAVNALQLKAWTSGAPVRVPDTLQEAFPEALAEIAAEPVGRPNPGPEPEQAELFREGGG